MKYKEFKENALKTESIPDSINVHYETTMLAMGIGVSASDVVDAVKKATFYKKPFDKETLMLTLKGLSDGALALQELVMNDQLLMDGEMEIEPDFVEDLRVFHGALGMFTEAGEMLAAVHSYAITGEFDRVNFAEEIGDSDWYKVILHDALGIDEKTCRATVIQKLMNKQNGRYKDGFTTEAAINRDLQTERAILEAGVSTR